MNQVQVNTNVKGQFVIPVAMRRYWEITPDTTLNITSIPSTGILIKPVPNKPPITNEEFLQILEETQGAWAGDDWPETEAKQRKIELKAARELKKAW